MRPRLRLDDRVLIVVYPCRRRPHRRPTPTSWPALHRPSQSSCRAWRHSGWRRSSERISGRRKSYGFAIARANQNGTANPTSDQRRAIRARIEAAAATHFPPHHRSQTPTSHTDAATFSARRRLYHHQPAAAAVQAVAEKCESRVPSAVAPKARQRACLRCSGHTVATAVVAGAVIVTTDGPFLCPFQSAF